MPAHRLEQHRAHAAVDDDLLAVDVGRGSAGEEHGEAGEVARRPPAAHRHAGVDALDERGVLPQLRRELGKN